MEMEELIATYGNVIDEFTLGAQSLYNDRIAKVSKQALQDPVGSPLLLAREDRVLAKLVADYHQGVETLVTETGLRLDASFDPEPVDNKATLATVFFVTAAIFKAEHSLRSALVARQIKEKQRKKAVSAAIRSGLAGILGVVENEAGTTYSRLLVANAKSNGIQRYIWWSQGDQRVRPKHRSRHGEKFKFSSPPSDGHPGASYSCRCFAEYIK